MYKRVFDAEVQRYDNQHLACAYYVQAGIQVLYQQSPFWYQGPVLLRI